MVYSNILLFVAFYFYFILTCFVIQFKGDPEMMHDQEI